MPVRRGNAPLVGRVARLVHLAPLHRGEGGRGALTPSARDSCETLNKASSAFEREILRPLRFHVAIGEVRLDGVENFHLLPTGARTPHRREDVLISATRFLTSREAMKASPAITRLANRRLSRRWWQKCLLSRARSPPRNRPWLLTACSVRNPTGGKGTHAPRLMGIPCRRTYHATDPDLINRLPPRCRHALPFNPHWSNHIGRNWYLSDVCSEDAEQSLVTDQSAKVYMEKMTARLRVM